MLNPKSNPKKTTLNKNKIIYFLAFSLILSFIANLFMIISMTSVVKSYGNNIQNLFQDNGQFQKLMAQQNEAIKTDVLNAINSSSLYQDQKEDIQRMIEASEQSIHIYTEAYVKTLTEKSAEALESLYPKGSIERIAHDRFEQSMLIEDKKTYDMAVKHGIIKDDKESLMSKLQKAFPDKSKDEIIQMILEKN